MTLASIMNAATSGMSVAQLGLSTVSTNISNVNTPGYVREVIDPTSLVTQGLVTGVGSSGVQRAANVYLQNASLAAAGQASQASVVSNLLGQAQSLFGDPTSSTSYLNSLGQMFSDFTSAANNPTSVLPSTQAVSDVNQFLSQSQGIAGSLNGLTAQTDSQVTSDIGQVNLLLTQIGSLNTQINATSAQGADASGAQNQQSELINQLSSLIDVKVATNTNGTVKLTSTSGVPLVTNGNAATLSYQPIANGAGQISVTSAGSTATSDLKVTGGEIRGLLDLRGTQLPAMSAQLSEFVSQTVNALNAAHNASSTVPAPATLTGQNVNVDLPTAVTGFTGKTNIVVVNSNGVAQQTVTVDFGAQTMSVNGGAPAGFTPATFLASLNGALGGSAMANFTNGVLSIQASAAGNGVAIADDPTTPSSKVGEGFSQYFGMNNLISSTGVTNYNTGLQLTDPSNITGTLTLRVTDGSGARVQDVTVTAPAGGTMSSLLASLNDPTTGVGLYGQFSLNSQGALSFSPGPSGGGVTVLNDTTQVGAGGPSMSQFFGIGDTQRASRIGNYAVRSDILANPSNLSLAQINLGAAAGQPALSAGSGAGGLALANAGNAQVNFAAAGGSPAATTSVLNYAAQFAGQIGIAAATASQAATSATAVRTEADTRRQSVEGVNLDQELVDLTTYQQAYSASARLIQATTDIFTALIGVVP